MGIIVLEGFYCIEYICKKEYILSQKIYLDSQKENVIRREFGG